jgi:uncharacterized protein (TIGR03086 family)
VTPPDGPLSLHRRAIESCATVVGAVGPQHLDLPTPCGAWTVRDLLAHMIGHNIGFAAAALGNADMGAFADVTLTSDLSGRFAASARVTVAAFAGLDLTRDEVHLAVVRGGTTWPAPTAIGFHLVDSVVHGWDVAAAVGAPISYDDDVEQAALDVALAVPDDRSRTRPGASFRPSVTHAGSTTLERILAVLGRDPNWTGQ